MAARDFKQAADLLEPVAHSQVSHGELMTVRHWLEALPEELVRPRPQLCLAYAMILLSTDQFEAAEQHFGLMDESDPLRAYGMFNLGVAYRANNQLQDARRTFRRLDQLDSFRLIQTPRAVKV